VPLFVGEEGETIEDAIKSERFDAVADVLNALQEHDDELVDLIRELRQAKGEGKPFKPRITGEKIELIGPRVDLDRIVESVETRIADQLGTSWDEWFGRLIRFHSSEGHAEVPIKFLTGDGLSLGLWVRSQRRQKDKLPPSRRERLEALGFVWDPYGGRWEEGYLALRGFVEKEGHSQVHRDFVAEDGFKLGRWVVTQRNVVDKLPPTRRERLEALGFVWDPLEQKWEEGFLALKAFFTQHGHTRVPRNFVTEDGFKLGNWVKKQRGNKKLITAARRVRLDDLGFAWGVLT
jgi:hypothetical protein